MKSEILKIRNPYALLDKNYTYALRGLAMLLIIFHHVYCHTTLCHDYIPHFFCRVLGFGGFLGTGIFFLLSGYGIYFSLKKNDIVSFAWLYKNLLKLLKPFIFALIIIQLLKWGG